jgi:hypothetical protein
MDVSPDREIQPRKLVYFPIIHTQADMGGLGESVKKALVRKIGRPGWKRKLDLVDRFWNEIEKTVAKLPIPFDRVRVYQDGLPVSGNEHKIVSDLAASGSRNHALLLRLSDRGAHLMGTESLELILEEYEMAKRDLESGGSQRMQRSDKSSSASLLEKRDRFIARRINETLGPGEVGMIFLGMLHSLEQWLAEDIQVIYPLHRPVERPLSGDQRGD